MISRLRLEIEGLVQGVGFRPLVMRLARELGLSGWVRNTGCGVLLELQGPTQALDTLLQRLQRQLPANGRIDRIHRLGLPLQEGERGFGIKPALIAAPAGQSHEPSVRWALIQPDLAPCPACRAELRDPTNRRCGHAFISCVQCGPRYSLVGALPFERVHTSLAAFPLCPACQKEYDDPGDRRCHAQTVACPRCGPRLSWWNAAGEQITDPRQPSPGGASPCLQAAAAALNRNQIVGLKGVGGFQLLVRARSQAAVSELRRRKGRPEKPLAVMAPDLAWVRRHCQLSREEAQLLDSPAAPIVLLRRRGEAGVCDAVAPGNPWLGVMLPSSPLHLLLLELLGEPLVATSGNRSGEPLCHDETTARQELAGLADGFLVHDRAILNPVDDSVAQVVCGEPMLLRHARGYAPTAVDLPGPTAALALGGQLKSALAYGWGRRALLGPHLGDLDTEAGERHYRRSLKAALARHGLDPASYAVDQHPGYRSRRIGLELASTNGRAAPLAVQHHHAHLLACLAEHGLTPPQVGAAWDGAGQGSDGTLWGGEVLRLEQNGFCAVARLRPFPLPGAERALREPRRAALGLLFAVGGSEGLDQAAGLAPLEAFTAGERQVLTRMLEQELQSPFCSSVGRLFDAVASLLGLQQRCSFEGQAALRLEASASQAAASARRPYALPLRTATRPWLIDWQPLLQDLLDDRRRGVEAEAIALGFHHALAKALVALAQRLELEQLLLGGGCFQNRLLLRLTVEGLRRVGIEPLWPRRIPCNDGGLALGQLVAVSLGRSG
ncbi:carbamoyltransferase HypF [Synechococcus sp. CS-205]|uniref:carbamoyltransferase HypF n=1 Tax=Synechococcus sp. CS-205 TaxID=2847984 RepID=UPI00223BF625|nr:carbamoyltransferase HypF [Synechococcus sp. CS-205]MCT0249086.1 carbamoyltransferase HypF [Synechococcus sp. CS-205]